MSSPTVYVCSFIFLYLMLNNKNENKSELNTRFSRTLTTLHRLKDITLFTEEKNT